MAVFSTLTREQAIAFCELWAGVLSLQDFDLHRDTWAWEDAIDAAIQVNYMESEDQQIPDMESRIWAAYVLQKQRFSHEMFARAASAYIALRNPPTRSIVSLSTADIINVVTGVRLSAEALETLTHQGSSKFAFSPAYRVVRKEHVKTLERSGEKPKPSCKVACRPGQDWQQTTESSITFTHKDGHKKETFFVSIEGEMLYYSTGNLVTFMSRKMRHLEYTASVNLSPALPVKLQMKLPSKLHEDTNKLRAEDLTKILVPQNKGFTDWFYCIALQGKIRGHAANCDRTCWFMKKAEAGQDGVRLAKPTQVSELSRYLGLATWLDLGKTRMRFHRSVDSWTLGGCLVGTGSNGGYLKLEWEEGPPPAPQPENPVDCELYIGRPYSAHTDLHAAARKVELEKAFALLLKHIVLPVVRAAESSDHAGLNETSRAQPALGESNASRNAQGHVNGSDVYVASAPPIVTDGRKVQAIMKRFEVTRISDKWRLDAPEPWLYREELEGFNTGNAHLQYILTRLGFMSLDATKQAVGYYKGFTEAAVQSFRKHYRIEGSNMKQYDPETAKKMGELVRRFRGQDHAGF